MKTNVLLLLALSIGTHTVHAGKPTLSGPALRQAGAAIKVPTIKTPSIKVPAIRPAAPAAGRSSSASRHLDCYPAGQFPSAARKPAPAISGSRSTLPIGTGLKNPTVSGGGRLPGFGANQGAALRQGMELANGLKEMGQLRSVFPQGFAMPGGTASGGSKGRGIDLSLDGGSFNSPRNVTNPLDRNRDGGLTDIRGGAEGSRKGTGHGSRPMSSFGRDLATSGPRNGSVTYTTSGNSRYAGSSYDQGEHVTGEHRDGNGRTTGYTDAWVTTETGGTRRTTDTYNSDGSFAGSETVIENDDGSSQSKSVAADGSVVVTERDQDGNVTQYESAGSGPPAARSCDRSGGDISNGGPVNGNGPSVAAAAGLTSLDLLRQTAEGGSTGGTNRMTSGQLGSNQVRPIGPDATTSSGGPGHRIAVDSFGTISNPSPTGGGDAGSGQRPD